VTLATPATISKECRTVYVNMRAKFKVCCYNCFKAIWGWQCNDSLSLWRHAAVHRQSDR